MKRILFPTATALVLSSIFSASTAFAAVEPAPVFVKRISDALITRLVSDRGIYKKNPAALNQIVQQNIEPFIDFDGFARGVMGPYYRQASPEQRKAFAQTFRQSLIRTYAKGLAAYDNESYTIRPLLQVKTQVKQL
jgi:phospholipid transport system substrate-binding protein